MDDLPDTLEELAERLEALESRVAVLECPSLTPHVMKSVASGAALLPQPSVSTPLTFSGGPFTVLGRSLLGIAGAYVLRFIEQSTNLPKVGVAGVAILYAVVWLIWAARVPRERWFESTVFACTSAAILGPMLWELTLTFNVLRPEAAAAVLVGFVAIACVLGWKHDRAPMLSVAYISSIAATFALAVGTHAMLPFTAVILFIVALCEVSAVRDHRTGAGVLAALAADGMIAAILFIYAGPESSRMSYPPLGTLPLLTPALLLFLIFAIAVTVKTLVLRKPISMFETMQTTTAFGLMAAGFAWLAPSGLAFLGWVCLALSVTVYVACVKLLPGTGDFRNFHVFSWWAFALFAFGSLLGSSSTSQTVLVEAAAVCAMILGVRTRQVVFQYQCMLLLLLAAAISGAAGFGSDCLFGTLPANFSWSLFGIAISAAVCYALQRPTLDDSWLPQVLRLTTAFLAISAVSALFIEGLASLITLAITPGAHHIALIRTGVICLLALMLAFSGRRWGRIELTRISYGALALVTLKLLVEDLRNPRLEFIAASIFFVAATLLVVPRIARLPRKS